CNTYRLLFFFINLFLKWRMGLESGVASAKNTPAHGWSIRKFIEPERTRAACQCAQGTPATRIVVFSGLSVVCYRFVLQELFRRAEFRRTAATGGKTLLVMQVCLSVIAIMTAEATQVNKGLFVNFKV